MLAYLAGIIDGEGHIGLTDRKSEGRENGTKLTIEVQMCDREPIDLLHETFGGSLIFRERKAPHRGYWRWRVTHKAARECYEALLPYLRLKRKIL